MRPKNLEKEKAIRAVALQIIAEEGLENLSMQKLAAAANISPRTIYIKYRDKEDLLIKLFIEEVLVNFEKAAMAGFDDRMDFATGIKTLWSNVFTYMTKHRHEFSLLRYGQSSPLLNKAYAERGIKEGDYFKPFLAFLKAHITKGHIRNYPPDIYRALLFAPLFNLLNEYFDYQERPKQIITKKVVDECCEMVIKGILK